MLTILGDLPALVNAYAEWLDSPDLASVRPCPCGHPFRHRHGSYPRWVLLPDGEAVPLRVLRLKCPRCRKTEGILPDFLRPRYQYPWPTQQALVQQYVEAPDSYRQVAGQQAGLSYQRLWQWVQAVSTGAADLARRLVAEIAQWAPGSAVLAAALADGRSEPLPRPKALAATKQVALGWIRPLLRQAGRLWQVGHERGAGWGPPDPRQALRFLETYRLALSA